MDSFHLIGIGGAGMSVVAELLVARGHPVTGSDQKDSEVLTRLRRAGVQCWPSHDAAHVPSEAVVVVSSAVGERNPELAEARRRDQRVLHRSEALALAAQDMDFVAVAGAHGKTTTSAMLAVALRGAGLDPSFAVGSSIRGVGTGAHLGRGGTFVAEADESDGSFLNYRPRVALVTNIEPDHLDHYGTRAAFETAFVEFVDRLVPGGLLIVCVDDAGGDLLAREAIRAGTRTVTYGCSEGKVAGVEWHVVVDDVTVGSAGTAALLKHPGGRTRLELAVPGRHNALNAAGAWAVGVELGIPPGTMARALSDFSGTGRRFEDKGQAAGVRVFDDYAHHPTEVAATLEAARAVAGEGRLVVLFQPHLYSRTRLFAEEFAAELGAADEVVITDVYAAREEPVPGIDGSLVASRVPQARYEPDRDRAAQSVTELAEPGDVIVTMGAGDVTELAAQILQQLGTRV